MSFKAWLNLKVGKMDYIDIALIKWSCIVVGVLLVFVFPGLLRISPGYLLAIALLLAIRPFYRVYLK